MILKDALKLMEFGVYCVNKVIKLLNLDANLKTVWFQRMGFVMYVIKGIIIKKVNVFKH